MSIRKINFAPNEYYHIYNRGNSKQKIFRNVRDYDRFMKLLYLSNSKNNFEFRNIKNHYAIERGDRIVSIGAYCLMPNHFHLSLKELEDGGITRFMHKLQTSYSMYYNLIYKRSGALYEGKFKSQYLNNDNYLKYVFSYIHLNPIKIIDPHWKEGGVLNINNSINFLKTYKYSSYPDYLNFSRVEKMIISPEDFPDFFLTKENLEKEIFEWINYNHTEARPP